VLTCMDAEPCIPIASEIAPLALTFIEDVP
jgi:hypothetical protein